MTERADGNRPSWNQIHAELAGIINGVVIPELEFPEEFAGNVQSQGSYLRVRLVWRATGVEQEVQRGNPVSRLLKRATDAGSREVKWADEKDLLDKIKAHVVQGGLITQSEVNAIPTGDKFRIRRTHGNLLLAISAENTAYKREIRNRQEVVESVLGKEAFEMAAAYDLGLILSDLFEILPKEKSAAILLSCADPEVSEELLRGKGHQGLAGDTQQLATVAIVLMPREVRHEIFKEMVKIDPKFGGRADTLFRNLVSNFYQSGSSFGGANMILMNLAGEEGQEKVAEFADDFTPLGEIVRSNH